MSDTIVQMPIRFPNREQHPSVRVSDPDTCQEPSETRMSSGRLKVLAAHYHHPEGLTDFELSALIKVQQTSCGKRRGELEKAGLIVATTTRRPSPSGAKAIVWRITSQGVGYIVRLSDTEVQS